MDTPTIEESPATTSIPFEDSSQPFFSRFFATLVAVLTKPIVTFSGMQGGPIGAPLLYGTLIGAFGVVIVLAWQFLLVGTMIAAQEEAGLGEFAVSSGMMIMIMFISPFLVAFGLFFNAGVYHLMLMLFGGNKKGFSLTFRAVAYGQSPAILMLIPICGGWVAGIWTMVLIIMGAIYGHSIDGWRGVLAYFLPTIVCCGLMFFALSSLGLIGALANQ